MHFEFYLSSTPVHLESHLNKTAEGQEEYSVCEGPSTVDVEPMTWDLPIKIVPCNPMHASAISLLKTTSTAILK